MNVITTTTLTMIIALTPSSRISQCHEHHTTTTELLFLEGEYLRLAMPCSSVTPLIFESCTTVILASFTGLPSLRLCAILSGQERNCSDHPHHRSFSLSHAHHTSHYTHLDTQHSAWRLRLRLQEYTSIAKFVACTQHATFGFQYCQIVAFASKSCFDGFTSTRSWPNFSDGCCGTVLEGATSGFKIICDRVLMV